jgi:LPS sulfotransferase NodH
MVAQYDSYVICTSPRSGSTLLCKLLAATGVAGNPASYFHRPELQDWLDRFGLVSGAGQPERDVLDAIFRAAITEGSRGTGMFGLRLQRQSFDFFTEKLALLHPTPATDAGRFAAAFGRTLFIHLSRRDKVEQAVSCVKAEQTGLWHVAPDGTELERVAPPRAPVYDAAEIRAWFDAMTSYDRDWQDWFGRQGIEPHRISYEALSADPQGVLSEILDRLGLDSAIAKGIAPGVRKLADRVNTDWAGRFRADFGIGQ